MHQFNKLTAVQAVSDAEGQLVYSGVELSRKGKRIIVSQKYAPAKLLSDLGIPANTSVFLVVSGKGIIDRWINQDSDLDNVVNKVFSGAQSGNYFSQYVPSSDQYCVSVTRQERFDAIKEEFNQAELKLQSVYLGNPVLINFLNIIGLPTGEHHFQNFKIKVKEEVVDLTKVEEEGSALDFGGQKIDQEIIWSYALAFLLMSKLFEVQEESGDTSTLDEYKAKDVFMKMGRAALISILILLLANTFLFMSFRGKVEEVGAQAQMVDHIVDQKRTLENKTSVKQSFLKNTGWLEDSKLSYFADRIALSIPNDIQLRRFDIHPYQSKESEKMNKPTFLNHQIEIDATCNHPMNIDPWVKQLEDFDWVKEKIIVEGYKFDNKLRKGFFSLRIKIKS